LTIAGAVAALDDVEEFEQRMKQLRKGRDYLERELDSMHGLSVIAGEGNFVLLDVAKTAMSAEAIVESMLTEGVYIRSLSVHHAKRSYVRVTVGTAEQNQRCVDAMRLVLSRSARAIPQVPVSRVSQP
jgi:histidinol-phosphate aminotransferase